MEDPLISIVMPAYNAEKYIDKSIESVLNQTYRNIELIIINDCSKDKTEEIIEKYCKQDIRVRKYTNQINSGVSFSRNFGVEQANGEWIAFLDSDDMIHPQLLEALYKEEKLQKQIDLLNRENMEPLLIYTGSSFIDENENPYSYIR